MFKAPGVFGLLVLLPANTVWAQHASAPDASVVIKHTVQEIVVDAVVRDSQGRIVKNLKPGDLQVFENGAPQQIRSFKLVQGREAAGKAAGAPSMEARVAAAPNPLKPTNLVCIVFCNLDAFTRKYAVDAAQEFVKNQLQPDTWVAVFNLASQLTVLQPFTTNKNELMAAANRAFTGTTADFVSMATAVRSASPLLAYMAVTQSGDMAHGGTVSADLVISGGELNVRAITGADVATGSSANVQRGIQALQRRDFGGIEARREMDQIDAMVRQLSTLPGRKSVLLFSPGLATTGDPELFKAMVDKAQKADVTVYAIDVNGLAPDLDQSQASSIALNHAAGLSSSQGKRGSTSTAQEVEKMHEGDYVLDAVRTTNTQSALRALAEDTGGFLIGSTNDLRKPFQRILDEVDTHYELIYHPSSDVYDGRLRTIDVKADRPGLSIQTRGGYFALPVLGSSSQPLTPGEMAGLAALSMKDPPRAFHFDTAAYQFRPGAAASQNAAVFEIPATNIEAAPEPGGAQRRMRVDLVALVKDSSGQVVDKFSRDVSYDIPEANLAKVKQTSISFSHPMNLSPGRYTLETAVIDREGGRASTSKTWFESPQAKGVALSSVVLVQGVEPVKGKRDTADPLEFQPKPNTTQRVIPELAATVPANASPHAFFVVYPDPSIAEKPKIEAEFRLNGQVVAKQTAPLPAPDATGAIPMIIQTAAKPGDCELRINAVQGASSAQQILVYSVAAK